MHPALRNPRLPVWQRGFRSQIIILDRYISGSVDRVSPEAPVPVFKPSAEEIRLGGAANVALNLSSLGSNATLIGVTGKDSASTEIIDLLKKNNIKKALSKSDHPTISKLRILASQQQLIRIDNEEEFSETDWQSSLSHYKKHISYKKNKVLWQILRELVNLSLQGFETLEGVVWKLTI